MKTMMMKLSPYALLLACGLASSPLHAADVLKKAQATGVVKLGVRSDNGGLSYAISDGKYGGFHYELCTLVVQDLEKQLNRKLEIQTVPVTSQGRLASVVNGDVDMECGVTTNNATRQKDVAFAVTTYVEEVRVAVKANSGINAVNQLAGKTVATVAGTTSVPLLRKQQRGGADLKEATAKNDQQAFNMLASGQADAYAMDGQILAAFISSSKNPAAFKLLPEVLSVAPIDIMLPKDDAAFKKLVDAEMRRIIFSGEIHPIYQRWFTQPIPPRGINLELPMSYMLKESFRFPSDKVGDLGG